jgi:precorrin-6B methylase 2
VTVHIGPALDTMPRLAGPFDVVFIDADKPNNPAYLDWSLRLSRPGTLIVAAAQPRLSATAIQTVGSKGYDGFALALVTS